MRGTVCLVVVLVTVAGMPADHGSGEDMRAESPSLSNTEKPTLEELGVKPQLRFNCTDSHRPHGNDSNKFQVFHNGKFRDQTCQLGLVWNQTMCRCDYDWAPRPPSSCREYRPHPSELSVYQHSVNGRWMNRDCNHAVSGLVWNQTSCRCEWSPGGEQIAAAHTRTTPCDPMFNVTFEDGVVDHAKNSFIELSPNAKMYMRKNTGSGSRTAAYLEDAVMSVWYFAGNEMSDSVRVEFKFRAETGSANKDKYQIILSNGCNVTDVGYTTPSLAIGYRAADQSFLLALETQNVKKAIVCTREVVYKKAYDWHKVSMIYEDGTLLMRVDNQPCIISEDFAGPIQKTSCPLTIGSDPLERESRFHGYLDDISVSRYCQKFVEDIPVDDLYGFSDNNGVDDNHIQPFSNMAALV